MSCPFYRHLHCADASIALGRWLAAEGPAGSGGRATLPCLTCFRRSKIRAALRSGQRQLRPLWYGPYDPDPVVGQIGTCSLETEERGPPNRRHDGPLSRKCALQHQWEIGPKDGNRTSHFARARFSRAYPWIPATPPGDRAMSLPACRGPCVARSRVHLVRTGATRPERWPPLKQPQGGRCFPD